MRDVYITGHRNPDLDSICSAYGYSVLKNMIDKDHTYHAVRCGHMSDGVKKQFALMGIEAPPYMRDVKPKVGDVMLHLSMTWSSNIVKTIHLPFLCLTRKNMWDFYPSTTLLHGF